MDVKNQMEKLQSAGRKEIFSVFIGGGVITCGGLSRVWFPSRLWEKFCRILFGPLLVPLVSVRPAEPSAAAITAFAVLAVAPEANANVCRQSLAAVSDLQECHMNMEPFSRLQGTEPEQKPDLDPGLEDRKFFSRGAPGPHMDGYSSPC
ncbi:hypothetical protein FQA47_017258 [Oryzias melastigma]|uniref:Uncharacterized protein n=1 Tax=Oryzias melastigma TaxID=30732 RepID=A0A834C4Q6_ORYME|nr:hypothetical protein FQA47_017258 [Oryzias melastigma]